MSLYLSLCPRCPCYFHDKLFLLTTDFLLLRTWTVSYEIANPVRKHGDHRDSGDNRVFLFRTNRLT